jgi:epoxyqueuosine reductase
MGGNFRQSLIFTDLPLALDKPINAGVNDFCKTCKICAEYCPTGAIDTGDNWNWEMAGVRRWDVDGSKCYTTWEQVSGGAPVIYKAGELGRGLAGCRACISACPWFRKSNWLHNTVREVLAKDPTRISEDVALWFERGVYPRNPADSLLPPDMKGVHDPPKWLVTADYIDKFVDTPMGGA